MPTPYVDQRGHDLRSGEPDRYGHLWPRFEHPVDADLCPAPTVGPPMDAARRGESYSDGGHRRDCWADDGRCCEPTTGCRGHGSGVGTFGGPV
jgi:hypothetical protein